MRLSEAIRLGAMNSPQAFGTSLNRAGHTCALGAAMDAIGVASSNYMNAVDHFDELCTVVTHPVTGERLCLLSVVRVLNDEHRWTRERIADFVEAVEPAPPVDAVGEAYEQPVAVHAR